MCEAMLLPSTMTQQPMANSVSSPCKAGSSQPTTVNLRASPYRPPHTLKSPRKRSHRPINRSIAQAAEVVAVPEPEAKTAQERKKKIAIFVEPSPFSHVSGKPFSSAPILTTFELVMNSRIVKVAPRCIRGTVPKQAVVALSCATFAVTGQPYAAQSGSLAPCCGGTCIEMHKPLSFMLQA